MPTSVGSKKKQDNSRKNIYFCFIDYAKAFDCVDHSKLWKILQEMGIPDHLTCLLRNLHAGQEATVRIKHGTKIWCQTGKEMRQGCTFSDKQNIFIQISKSYMNIKSKKKKHGIMKKNFNVSHLLFLYLCASAKSLQ